MGKILIKNVLIAFVFVFISCNKELENNQPNSVQERTPTPPDYLIGLGKKLENPYSVENMEKAWENLKAKKASSFKGSEIEINTTDIYVRFLPEDDAQKQILQGRDSLFLFDMPLDYELEEGVGGSYHDPSIPEGEITWQYTVVPLDYEFPEDIKYEVLDELFLQDDFQDETSRTERKGMNASLWAELENTSLALTGNFEDSEKEKELTQKRKWWPKGRIMYEEIVNTSFGTTRKRTIPLQGANVIVKRWFKWKRDITDAQGRFSVGKFRSKKVKVAIKWERADWDIRSGSYGQAWYSFETLKKGNNWNKTIKKAWTPRNWFYASIHRGAMEYMYNYNAYGIRKPFQKQWLRPRLHIGAKYKKGRAHYYDFKKIYWAAPVVLFSQTKSGRVLDSRDVFGTTVHEMAHVSHWQIGYNTGHFVYDALTNDPVLPESWATGVEHVVGSRKFPKSVYGTYDFDLMQLRLLDYIKNNEGYTPIVIDMIDSRNQHDEDNRMPNDRVSGFTLAQLEKALPGAFGSWWKWRSKLREMYNNPTDGEPLDYLFKEYY